MSVRPVRDDDGEKLMGADAFNFTTTQRVAIGAASAQSAALQSGTRLIRLTASVFCYVVIGANPVATNAGFALAANESVLLPVSDAGLKVAVIQEGAAGALGIAEVS